MHPIQDWMPLHSVRPVHGPVDDGQPVDVAVAGGTDGALSIGAVSLLTGIPIPTIRSWERRYGLPVTHRDASGYRRYTAADAQTLRALRAETAAGRSTAAVAARLREAAAAPPAHVAEVLVAAAHQLDPRTVSRELEQARHRHGLEVTLEEVVLPALREIGAQWGAGHPVVAHEHLLTGVVLGWLGAVEQQAPPASRPAPVLLACGPDEQHTIALHAFATLLAHRGFDCRVLGGHTPGNSLVAAVTTTRAQAVVLVCHRDQHRPATLAALRNLTGLPCRLYYAGGAFTRPSSRHDVPGAYLGDSLTTAAHQITDDADDPEEGHGSTSPLT